jgi:exopolyphosphatase/guanosine-5'-triphosphate,3'-diphosphate pyrophosphatase
MHDSQTTLGVMDIGSNSIRLAVYEVTNSNAYRLIYENKESARLSQKINTDGAISHQDILTITPILSQFGLICTKYGCHDVIVAATAAIRNATNREQIINVIYEETGLKVKVLTGEQEAYYGFLGVVSTMDINDGFIIDIGGGSSEITLFRHRRVVSSVSLPLGAVNGQELYSKDGVWDEQSIEALQAKVTQLITPHAWIKNNPHLPLIGLGGTSRTLAKMDQRRVEYPMNLAHYYRIEGSSLKHYEKLLPELPLERRKAIDGLAKSRADIIVPGIIILNTIYNYIHADYYLVSGTGLREGLMLEVEKISVPVKGEVVPFQIKNILAFDNASSKEHVEQVQHTAELLYESLQSIGKYNSDDEILLYAAAKLYQIGMNIRYHQYDKHTFYWLTHVPMIGLDHHQALICACIASGMMPNKKALATYKSMLNGEDFAQIERLSTILQLAIALDVSRTQSLEVEHIVRNEDTLTLRLLAKQEAPLELRELEGLTKSFKKAWGVNLKVKLEPSSMP